MKAQPIKFCLSKETIRHLEKNTRCSINELSTLTLDETNNLMLKRGAIKKPSKIKQWFADKYKKFGEIVGLLKKDYNFYTHID